MVLRLIIRSKQARLAVATKLYFTHCILKFYTSWSIYESTLNVGVLIYQAIHLSGFEKPNEEGQPNWFYN